MKPQHSAHTIRTLPWWTRPSTVNLVFVLPLLLVVIWVGSSDFRGLTIRAQHFLTWPYIVLCIALVLTSALGAWLGEIVEQRSTLRVSDSHLKVAAGCLGLVILATYLFWFKVFLGDPSLLAAILTGDERPDRTVIGTVTGITSLVNMAPVFFGIAGYLVFRRTAGLALVLLTGVLLVLGLFRAYVWSERLALAEAAIPLALAWLSTYQPERRQWVRRTLYWLGPYAALPALFLFFALGEFFRTWSYYQSNMDFWEFAIGRFATYYYTAFNNGAGMLATNNWPDGTYQHVLMWLHKFPLGVGATFSDMVGLYTSLVDDAGTPAEWTFLRRYGDEEFNLPSSFLAVTFDVGVAGAMIYFFASMLAAGLLYTRYVAGDLLAVMLYPSVLVALFETFRYPYWGTPRAFVWLLGTVLVLFVLWLCGVVKVSALRTDRGHKESQPAGGRLGRHRRKSENIRAASV